MIVSIDELLNRLDSEKANEIRKKYSKEFLDYKISASDLFDLVEEDGKLDLKYKNQVSLANNKEIGNIIKPLAHSELLNEVDRPYFVFDIENIANAINNNEKVAVEGGPCLFGLDEVFMKIVLQNNEEHLFDYSTGRRSDKNEVIDILASELEMYNFIEDNKNEITNIEFINNKKGVTIDEYYSIKILFDLADCLKCPFVMPIVDMSYQKYLEYATREVKNDIREKALNDFKVVVYNITDMYLDVIKKLSDEYKGVEYKILHERNKELLDLYYEKRAEFIERKKVIHSLTDVPIRLEPIKDYCTMPALPYYIYGIKNILQVDCLDETDSHRKCKRAHRNTLNISALMYAEKVYDNKNTMFNLSLNEKKYI